jgi:hypothetical protein
VSAKRAVRNKTWAELKVGDAASLEQSCSAQDLILFAHVSGNQPFNLRRALVRNDWLFVRKEALVSLADAARRARVTQPPLRFQPIRGSTW